MPSPMIPHEDLPAPDALIDYGADGVGAAMFHYAPAEIDMAFIARAHGFQARKVHLYDDPDLGAGAVRDAYSDGASDILRRWTPAVPEGWSLAAKHDTDDGPVALFIRKIEEAPTDDR